MNKFTDELLMRFKGINVADPAYRKPTNEEFHALLARLESSEQKLSVAREACERALPLIQHLEKFLKYQTPRKQFYPNREQSDAVIGLLKQAIAAEALKTIGESHE